MDLIGFLNNLLVQNSNILDTDNQVSKSRSICTVNPYAKIEYIVANVITKKGFYCSNLILKEC
jgi:hypothetical protein